jgi:hypothetical protein
MFALGLSLEADTLGLLRRRPALMARVLIGSCLLVPWLHSYSCRFPEAMGSPRRAASASV